MEHPQRARHSQQPLPQFMWRSVVCERCAGCLRPAPAGFIYPVLPKPIGPSRGTNIVPAARPMLRFDGNSAHSSGYMWCVWGGATQCGGSLRPGDGPAFNAV